MVQQLLSGNILSHLAYVPDDFSGTLLDVPVGTAVFTEKKWRSLSKANITCLDYSVDMLEQAKKRLDDCEHISFVQGDVGDLWDVKLRGKEITINITYQM